MQFLLTSDRSLIQIDNILSIYKQIEDLDGFQKRYYIKCYLEKPIAGQLEITLGVTTLEENRETIERQANNIMNSIVYAMNASNNNLVIIPDYLA